MHNLSTARAVTASCAIALCLAACGGGGASSNSNTGTTNPTSYTVTANVSNLNAGTSFVLQNNGGDNLSISANGNFTFSTAIANGSPYAVTVFSEPAAQTCLLSGVYQGTSSTDVTVSVNCGQALDSVGGNVTGLPNGQSVTLQISNQGSIENYTISANGAFLIGGGNLVFYADTAYTISVFTQPTLGSCTVVDSTTGTTSGTVTSSSATELAVTCN